MIKGLLRVSVCERVFFIASFFLMTYVAWHGRNGKLGWDTVLYMDGLSRAQWLGQGTGITRYSYGYHLPLLFLIDRLVMGLGFSALHSVKLVDWVLLLGAFGAARAAFAHLGVLSRLHGMAMFYFTVSIPLNVFLFHGVHMEAPVLLSWALIFWGTMKLVRPHTSSDPLVGFWLIVVGAVFGMYCKYSALLNLAVPPLGALVLTTRKDTAQLWRTILLAIVTSLIAVWPYYYVRNYLYTGLFIPSNNDVFWPLEALSANQKIWRDEHPVEFFVQLFSLEGFGLPRHSPHNHLYFIWYDLWHRDSFIGPAGPRLNQISDIYLLGFAILAVLGLVGVLWRLRSQSLMQRFSLFMLGYSAIQLAAAIDYAWANPNGWMMSVKGIYLTPICFTAGMLIVTGFSVLMRPLLYRKFYRIYAAILVLGVGALLCFNYLLLVY